MLQPEKFLAGPAWPQNDLDIPSKWANLHQGTKLDQMVTTKIHWIEYGKIGPKQLGMMSRPRGNDWLEDEIKGLQLRGVHTVVSLLEYDEIQELGLEDEEAWCRRSAIEYINFPIEDNKVPPHDDTYLDLLDTLRAKLQQGQKVAIHCRMGIGRASLVIAGLLIREGMTAEQAFAFISKQREMEVPDTEEQVQWMQGMERWLQR
jgi:protein-tyrosine phosphatase